MPENIGYQMFTIAVAVVLFQSCKVCPADAAVFACDEFQINVIDSLGEAVPVAQLNTLKMSINEMEMAFNDVQEGEVTAFASVNRQAGCGAVSDIVLKDSSGVTVAEMKMDISNFNATHQGKSERKNCLCYPEITAITPVSDVEVVNIKCGENVVKVVWDE